MEYNGYDEFDEVFRDLERAAVLRQEVRCFKHEVDGRIRWIIEISDPEGAREFEERLTAFLARIRRMFRGDSYV